MTHGERARRRQQIATDVANGLSTDEAAQKYGVTQETVRNSCREKEIGILSIKIKQENHRNKKLKQAVKLLQNGETILATSIKVGVDEHTVANLYKKLPKKRDNKRSKKQLIERLIRENPEITYSSIAQKAGVSRERVRQLANGIGIDRTKAAKRQAARIVNDLLEGHSTKDVADMNKVKQSLVKYYAKKNRISTKTIRKDSRFSRKLKIIGELFSNRPRDQIAMANGVSLHFVYQLASDARSNGIPLPKRHDKNGK